MRRGNLKNGLYGEGSAQKRSFLGRVGNSQVHVYERVEKSIISVSLRSFNVNVSKRRALGLYHFNLLTLHKNDKKISCFNDLFFLSRYWKGVPSFNERYIKR